jgi:hypothetical protein
MTPSHIPGFAISRILARYSNGGEWGKENIQPGVIGAGCCVGKRQEAVGEFDRDRYFTALGKSSSETDACLIPNPCNASHRPAP